MVVVTIPSGVYAGLEAQQFSTQLELEAAINQGLLPDGTLVAVNQGVFPWVVKEGASYGFGLSEQAGFVGPVSSVYEVHPTQYSGEPSIGVLVVGAPLAAAAWLGIIKLAVIAIISLIILAGVYAIVGKWKATPVSSVQELACSEPPCPVIVTFPNGSGVILNPNDGEIIHAFGAPYDWIIWAVVAVGAVVVLWYVLPVVLKGFGREAKYTPYKPPPKGLEEYDVDVVD